MKNLFYWIKIKLLDSRSKWKPKVPIEYVYTDKYGINYYQLKNIQEISYKRSLAAEVATRQAEYNLTKEQLIMLLDEALSYIDENKMAIVAALLHEIKNRAEYAGEEYTLLRLASVYYFAEGEDIETFKEDEQILKINRWNTDDSAKAFFLKRAFERTKSYTSISSQDLMSYFLDISQDQQLISHILGTQSNIILTR